MITLKGIGVELLVATVVDYCGVLSPILAIWAIATLCMHSQEGDYGYCQTVFFGSMILIGFLTIRSMLAHDTHWLLDAVSLGILVVGGALKGPMEGRASVVSGS